MVCQGPGRQDAAGAVLCLPMEVAGFPADRRGSVLLGHLLRGGTHQFIQHLAAVPFLRWEPMPGGVGGVRPQPGDFVAVRKASVRQCTE